MKNTAKKDKMTKDTTPSPKISPRPIVGAESECKCHCHLADRRWQGHTVTCKCIKNCQHCMNKQGDSWEERFDKMIEKQVHEYNSYLDDMNMFKQFIHKEIAQAQSELQQELIRQREYWMKRVEQKQSELLEELLEQGHGGGNWRRLISMKLSLLQKEVKGGE